MNKFCIFLFATTMPVLFGADKKYIISDGTPYVLAEKGLTITPPVGWRVYPDYPGASLLLEPNERNSVYNRTIQVMTFNGPQYIDDVGAEKYSEVITNKFSEASGAVNGYRIRNHLPVDLETGVKGQLFYAEFSIGEFNLMHMHLLISSASRHFIITYTDLAEYFDAELGKDQNLTQAWASIGSVQLDSAPPYRYFSTVVILGIFAVMAFLAIAILRYNHRRAKRLYGDTMNSLENSGDDTLEPRIRTADQFKISNEDSDDDEYDAFASCDDEDNDDDHGKADPYDDLDRVS